MSKKKEVLKVKDFSVSGESFQLLNNEEYDMLETFPQPGAEELPKYYNSEDYISHTNSKRNFFEKAYHLVRWFSLKRKVKLIESYAVTSKSLLDIGCGTGDFLQASQKAGWKVFGIEPNEGARNIANAKTAGQVKDQDELQKMPDASFDLITLWHVLEHLPNLNEQILELKRLLKKEGTLIIAVPNFKSFDAKHYKEFWAAYDVPRHLRHFSSQAIAKLFSEKEFGVVETLPMKFDSFYVSLLSEKHKTGKMNFAKAVYFGLKSNMKAKRSGEYSSLIYVLKRR